MKYCLNSNVSDIYLRQADQILFVPDGPALSELLEKYTQATIFVPALTEAWDVLNAYKDLFPDRVKIATYDISMIQEAIKRDFAVYYTPVVKDYMTLHALEAMGCSEIFIDGPLFFDLPQVRKSTKMIIHACPNLSLYNHLPHQNPIHGTWIRPEDVHLYESYIDVLEPHGITSTAQGTAYKIYAIDGRWNGDIANIILDFNKDNKIVPNYNIVSDLAEHRVNCKQSCERLGSCTLCDRGFTFARTLLEAKGGVEFN